MVQLEDIMKIKLLILVIFIAGCQETEASKHQCRNGFKVLENIKYTDAPDFRQYGIEPIRTITFHDNYWTGDPATTHPDEELARKFAAALPSSKEVEYYYHGIENLPREAWKTTELQLFQTLSKVTSIASWVKSERPTLKFGNYKMLPDREYVDVTNQAWKDYNTMMMPYAQHVDFIAPSIYTVMLEEDDWFPYAEANLAEAKRVAQGKAVYAFMWPQYHLVVGNNEAYLNGKVWRDQLDFMCDKADGVIIWVIYDLKNNFENSADDKDPRNWWFQTLDFMEDNNL